MILPPLTSSSHNSYFHHHHWLWIHGTGIFLPEEQLPQFFRKSVLPWQHQICPLGGGGCPPLPSNFPGTWLLLLLLWLWWLTGGCSYLHIFFDTGHGELVLVLQVHVSQQGLHASARVSSAYSSGVVPPPLLLTWLYSICGLPSCLLVSSSRLTRCFFWCHGCWMQSVPSWYALHILVDYIAVVTSCCCYWWFFKWTSDLAMYAAVSLICLIFTQKKREPVPPPHPPTLPKAAEPFYGWSKASKVGWSKTRSILPWQFRMYGGGQSCVLLSREWAVGTAVNPACSRSCMHWNQGEEIASKIWRKMKENLEPLMCRHWS